MVSFSSVPCFCLHASCKAASFGDVHSSDPRACFFELLLFFIGRSPFCTSSALFTGSVPQKYNPAGDRPSHLISDLRAGERTAVPERAQAQTASSPRPILRPEDCYHSLHYSSHPPQPPDPN